MQHAHLPLPVKSSHLRCSLSALPAHRLLPPACAPPACPFPLPAPLLPQLLPLLRVLALLLPLPLLLRARMGSKITLCCHALDVKSLSACLVLLALLALLVLLVLERVLLPLAFHAMKVSMSSAWRGCFGADLLLCPPDCLAFLERPCAWGSDMEKSALKLATQLVASHELVITRGMQA